MFWAPERETEDKKTPSIDAAEEKETQSKEKRGSERIGVISRSFSPDEKIKLSSSTARWTKKLESLFSTTRKLLCFCFPCQKTIQHNKEREGEENDEFDSQDQISTSKEEI